MNIVDSVMTALENAPAIIVPLVTEVPSSILKRRPAARKWSAHEHACHLAAVHPLFFSRLELILSNPKPIIEPYLPDVDDEEDALMKVNLDEAMRRYARERRELVGKLRKLSEKEWQMTAEHNEYSHYSVFIMFRHLAMHDMLHAYRIEELLLKRDWS